MLTQQQAYHGLDKSPAHKEANLRFVLRVWFVCAIIALVGVAGLIFVAK